MFLLTIDICLLNAGFIDLLVKSFLFSIIITGLDWISSFALQYKGEFTSLLRKCPRLEDLPIEELRKKDKNLEDFPEIDKIPSSQDSQKDWFYKIWLIFHESHSTKNFERIHAERLIIIKEACSNGSISLACCILITFKINLSNLFANTENASRC